MKGGTILRASVVGHTPFREIVGQLSVERVMDTGRNLADMIRLVYGKPPRILVAGINPCLEDGILETEEKDIILPAVTGRRISRILRSAAPCLPARSSIPHWRKTATASSTCITIRATIAMKARMFQTTACIYTNVPYPILSPGHGSALDIAELGVANPTNISYVLSTLVDHYSDEAAVQQVFAAGVRPYSQQKEAGSDEGIGTEAAGQQHPRAADDR